jgi:hypothetical protein
MLTRMVRLPLNALPPDGPTLVVVASDAAESPAARYLLAAKEAGSGSLPAARPLVAIIRCDPLSAPDEIRAMESARDGQIFRVTLESRRFTGALLANVVTVAVIEVDLGSLKPGAYDLVVTETKLHFQDLQNPENAADSDTVSHQLHFEVH